MLPIHSVFVAPSITLATAGAQQPAHPSAYVLVPLRDTVTLVLALGLVLLLVMVVVDRQLGVLQYSHG